MSILVTNGRYKYCSTNRAHSTTEYCHWWTYIPNIDSCITFRGTTSLPSVVGPTMASNYQYQTRLAEECSYIPEGQKPKSEFRHRRR